MVMHNSVVHLHTYHCCVSGDVCFVLADVEVTPPDKIKTAVFTDLHDKGQVNGAAILRHCTFRQRQG